MTRLRVALACLSLCALWSGPALAEEGTPLAGTLKTINDRGTILIGYREASVPFSFLNAAKQPIGFSLDICHAIAEDVARAINRDLLEPDAPAWKTGLRIVYVPVAADQRIPMVVSGAIDLECGSTTANAERSKVVAFSPVFFLSGTKLMVPLGPNGAPKAQSYRDLAGATIVASVGTTNAEAMRRLADKVAPPVKVAELPSLNDAYDALAAGKAAGFVSDDILLAGLIATHHAERKFSIVGDYLSFEPYAIMFRRDDAQLADMVKASFVRLASDGTLSQLYERWLVDRLPSGETLDVPMSPYLTEMYRALGQPD
jgi:glutamate/aspartate transport system substrate-binding protein